MLLLTAPIIWFSLNHDTAELKIWKGFDSCNSDSLKLMTQLTTPVISILTRS